AGLPTSPAHGAVCCLLCLLRGKLADTSSKLSALRGTDFAAAARLGDLRRAHFRNLDRTLGTSSAL
ncbi:MAG: hypothetical protein ACKO81_03290, partial [Planctomycetota bacterium]